jgi:cell division protein FtsB
MFKKFFVVLASMLVAATAFSQDVQDLDRRLKQLEEKIQKLQQTSETAELKREIDVLTHEIEALKSGQQRTAVEATQSQYGLGAAASKVYRSEPGVSFGGYGEFRYAKPEAGIASADVVRAVLYTGYKFSNRAIFNSELEVEHGSTEFAGDESRDAEGGSVSVEFAYLDYLLRPSANIRAGLVLIPTGLINEQHEPTAYFGTHRPEVEDRILPTTWSELGAGVFGDVGSVSYRGYVVTGLQGSRFSAADGVHEGKQGGASAAAEDLAVTGRVDWHPIEGTLFGGSLYSGGSGQGAGYRGRVTLGDLHADSKFRGLSLRALVARGHIGDAATISDRVGETIGSSLGGWYAEGAYDLGSMIGHGGVSLSPYLRYERLDTHRRVPFGFERDPENNRRITTFGLSFKPIPQTVIKTDWDRIKTGAGSSDNRFNIGVGYIF